MVQRLRSLGEGAEYLVLGIALLSMVVSSWLVHTFVPGLDGTPDDSLAWRVAWLTVGGASVMGGVGVVAARWVGQAEQLTGYRLASYPGWLLIAAGAGFDMARLISYLHPPHSSEETIVPGALPGVFIITANIVVSWLHLRRRGRELKTEN